ncbi:unnamed protein product [Prunus brigantina]
MLRKPSKWSKLDQSEQSYRVGQDKVRLASLQETKLDTVRKRDLKPSSYIGTSLMVLQ